MGLDLLLVDPAVGLTKRYDENFGACGNRAPSWGLCFIAAVARQEGFKVAIVDENIPAEAARLRSVLRDDRPRIVGITAATLSVSDAARVASAAKSENPGCLTVLGGAHVSSVPETTLERYAQFDVGVLGEGERSMLDLLRAGDFGPKRLAAMPGLAFRSGWGVVRSPRREIMPSLGEMPLPAMDLLPDLSRCYTPPAFSVSRAPALGLVVTRGCPGECTFCSNNLIHGRRTRYHSVDFVLELIKRLRVDYGIREIQFMDDTFTANRAYIKEFCERLIRGRWGLRWSCATRITTVDRETLSAMRRAVCWQVCYGIESGDPDMLEKIQKRVGLERIRETVSTTRELGISMKGFFIMGFPGETERSLSRTERLALELPLDDLSVSLFVPYPGTAAYDEILADPSLGEFHEDWDNMTSLRVNFVPRGFTRLELLRRSRTLFRRFYFRPRIVKSYLARLSSPAAIPVFARGVWSLLKTRSP